MASVLLVEDNDYNVDVCKQMLEFLNTRVTVAFNGREAIELIKQRDRNQDYLDSASGRFPFDLVLMDCDMPLMNGFEATRALRLWEREEYDDGSLMAGCRQTPRTSPSAPSRATGPYRSGRR